MRVVLPHRAAQVLVANWIYSMATPKHQQIVFDIIDELTDEAPFATWWWGLSEEKRSDVLQTLEQRTLDNIKPKVPARRPIKGIGKI